MNSITSSLQQIIDQQTTIFLEEDDQKTLIQYIFENESGIKQLTKDEQKDFFRLCMDHFGVFATIATNCLPALTPLLKYALISKSLYEFGACGAPEVLMIELEEFLKSEPREWWTPIETMDRIFNLREEILSNPEIGVETLLNEFPNCPDIDLLIVMLGNPIVPIELAQSIVDKEHFIFEELDEDGTDYLIESAEEVLNRPATEVTE